MVAVKNVSLAEEHLHDHFAADDEHDALPLMPASLMIEGMAQTAGILVGSVHGFREKVILAKIARAQFDRDVVPGQTIQYDAALQSMHSAGASTAGVVRCFDPASDSPQWEEIGRVDLMFSHIDQNMGGLTFPKENFVFSENFRTLLRSAGMEGLAEHA